MDKWSVLGDRRRGTMDVVSREVVSPDTKKRLRAREWRRNIGEKVGLSRTYGSGSVGSDKLDHGVWQQKEWSTSKDWRRSNQDLAKPSPLRPDASQLDGVGDFSDYDDDNNESAIIDDDDFVGGWKDLHL